MSRTDATNEDLQANEARQRRRRINDAFRSGDLHVCLEEIAAGLAVDPDDESLGKALVLVQSRYLAEVVEPAVQASQWASAETSLARLRSVGHLRPEVQERVEAYGDIVRDGQRSIAEEHLDVREKTLRRAEEAWSAGRKREARDLLRSLDGLPLDDHDLVLRRDGLRRLMEQETARPDRDGVQPHNAARWVFILIGVVVLAGAAYTLRGVVSPKPVEAPGLTASPALDPEPAPIPQPPDMGWAVIHTVPEEAEIADGSGALLGLAGEALMLPAGTHTVRITADGFQDTTWVVSIAAAESTAATISLAPVLPAVGTLALHSSPQGAEALLDGSGRLGTTPLEVSLEPGRYRIMLTADGKVPEWVDVHIAPGDVCDTTITLWTRYPFGKLQINATPWAFVFVNGDSLGSTPLTTGDLATGVDHETMFKRPDGSVIRQRVRLDPKRATPTPLTVGAATPAVLSIATRDSLSGRPTWATVWVGSRLLGESPGEFELPPGEVTLRVEREGYSPLVHTVQLNQGQRIALSLTLEPLEQ